MWDYLDDGVWVLQYANKPFVSDILIWYAKRPEHLTPPEVIAKITGLKQSDFSKRYYGKEDFYEQFKDYLRMPAD